MLVGGLIKWSKLLTYQTGLFGGGYLLGRDYNGTLEKPEMLKVKDKNARMFWYDPKWEGYEK